MSDNVILTPWHYVILPNGCPECGRDAKGRISSHGVLYHRLSATNPAVRDVLTNHDESWKDAFRVLVAAGATDADIWQGDWLSLLPIPLRTYLRQLLADMTGKPPVAAAPSGPEWIALVKAYRRTGKRRPLVGEVARQMDWYSEQPLRDYIHRLGIADWRAVQTLMAAEPD